MKITPSRAAAKPALCSVPRSLRPRAGLPAYRALGCLSLLVLAACGGGGDDPAPAPVTPVVPAPVVTAVGVAPSLGSVLNADVAITCAASGASLGTGSTGSTGLVTLSATGTCTGPVLVRVSGRSDGTSTYYDEALASVLPFPNGSSVRAILPTLNGATTVGVTPLTEMATRQALASAGSLAAVTSAQATLANSNVVTQLLGSGVTLDILQAPTPWNASTAAGSLGTSAADRYAFYLAGLAKLGAGLASPALAVTEALAADLADGVLSGTASGAFTYSASGWASQLSTGLAGMSAFANAGLQGALGITPVPLAITGVSPSTAASGATVTISGTGFDPDPFHLQVRFSNGVVASVTAASTTSVSFVVPSNAASGTLTLVNSVRNANVTSAQSFTFTPPSSGGGGGGTAWTSRASPNSFILNGLTYGSGKFVAVGFNRVIVTSTDGLVWSAQTASDTAFYQGNAVIWDGAQFVMVGDKNFGVAQSPLIATSPDGVSWTRRNWTPSANLPETMLRDVAAGAGKLTAVGANGAIVSSSDNGVTWVVEPGSNGDSFYAVAANTSTRVAVSTRSGNGTILVNTGSGWVVASGVSNFGPLDVTWTGTQFVAVGASGYNFGDSAVVMSSPDGVTWTRRALSTTEAPAGFKLQTVLAAGGTLYAVGDNGQTQHIVVSSTDGGSTWTKDYQGTTSGQAVLNGLATSGSRVVAVGGVKMLTLP
jgi:hypothetical protein